MKKKEREKKEIYIFSVGYEDHKANCSRIFSSQVMGGGGIM